MNRPYDEDYITTHLPATLKYSVTPSTNENLPDALFGHALMSGGATQINNAQSQLFKNYEFADATLIPSADSSGCFLPPVSADIGYTKPPYQTAEYGASGQTLVTPGQPPFTLNGDGQQNVPYENQPLGVDFSRPASETVQIPGRFQLQRRFLLFLTKNLPLLNSVPNSTPDGMARVQLAFEEHIHRSGLIPPFADIKKIFRQFQPIIGSRAIRQESDSRKTRTVKRECPFQFCAGNFTRAAGLKSHLSAHFKLAPNMCPLCGRCYSDVAFRRHVDNCRKAGSSHLND